MNEVRLRLGEFLKHKGLEKSVFERMCGLANGFVDKTNARMRRSSLNSISATFPDLNTDWLMSGNGSMIKDEVMPEQRKENEVVATNVPLLPLSAQGGTLNDFVISVSQHECEKIVSPIKDVDFAITVSGDSMAPEYPNGCQVFIKRINEAAFIEWGKAYVLDTCNGTVIKILTPSPKKNCVRCVSINPDPIFAPFDVQFNDIYGIYRVKLCMCIK